MDMEIQVCTVSRLVPRSVKQSVLRPVVLEIREDEKLATAGAGDTYTRKHVFRILLPRGMLATGYLQPKPAQLIGVCVCVSLAVVDHAHRLTNENTREMVIRENIRGKKYMCM